MAPEISIIVPVYNADAHLRDCIQSILSQTFPNFELILVNDGSKDNSASICEEAAQTDARIVYINKENGGSSSARNAGINIAKGRYIEFVDADDTIDSTYVENLYAGIKNENVDLCVGNLAFCKWEDGSMTKRLCTVHPGVFTLQEYLQHYPEYMQQAVVGAPWNKLYKKQILDAYALRLDETLRNNEDTQFNYAYLLHCRKVYVSAAPYYNYINWGTPSASHGYIEGVFHIYVSTYQKAIAMLKTVGMYAENEAFTKQYFMGLVIGAVNGIVLTKKICLREKLRQIREILRAKEVREALPAVSASEKKKKIALWLIQKKQALILYALLQCYDWLKGGSTNG